MHKIIKIWNFLVIIQLKHGKDGIVSVIFGPSYYFYIHSNFEVLIYMVTNIPIFTTVVYNIGKNINFYNYKFVVVCLFVQVSLTSIRSILIKFLCVIKIGLKYHLGFIIIGLNSL